MNEKEQEYLNRLEYRNRCLVDHCQTLMYEFKEHQRLLEEFEVHHYRVMEKDLTAALEGIAQSIPDIKEYGGTK